MKNNRQSMILDIIAKEHIETQEQLLEQLRKRGVASTQATISRDIKQLHLVKEPTGHGTYKYAVSSSRARLNIADKLRTIFPESITSGVRTMTANIVLEMGYAEGLHREALIATGVVLFVFILIINLSFSALKGKK